ncbi:hypothetical protein ACUHMQ_08680 [Chitinimonas sp. PSY-7]|uniref:hypothetical protein n=1 Tax=Chitinimonas sp. PSY-7 TaxID=3459088 RepID=UPI0040401FB3
MTSIAAERIWHAVSPTGANNTLVLRVGLPKQYPAGEWGCEISLGVLESIPVVIYGVDAWQAIELSMLYATRRVAEFAKQGWRFSWEPGDDPIHHSELALKPVLQYRYRPKCRCPEWNTGP